MPKSRSIFRKARRRLRPWISILLAFLFIVGLFWAARSAVGLLQPERIERTLAERSASPETLDAAIDFSRKAYFGGSAAPDLNSLEYAGTVRLEGNLVPFQAFKKKGRKYRFQLRVGEREERFVYPGNGQVVAHWVLEGESVERMTLPSEQASDFMRDAPMHVPFLWSDAPGTEYSFEGTVQRYGLPFLAIRRLSSGGTTERFLLSPETGLVRYREITRRGEDLPSAISEYAEFREVAGIQFPHRIFSWSQYRYRADIFIAKIEVNQGVLDRYFEN